MNYYTIAGIGLATEGIENPFFEQRMLEYRSEKNDSGLTIWYQQSDSIPVPEGERIATEGERSWILTSDGGYGFYDFVPEAGCIAAIRMDRKCRDVSAVLRDVSKIGGADEAMRSFNMVGEVFRYHILQHDGIVLHSSSLAYRNQGILFSAPSGTGKSTHTGLWKKYLGDAVTIINDDSPAVRFFDGRPYLCGTPWSGKTDINTNLQVPLRAVVFLQRGNENRLFGLEPKAAFFQLLTQVMRPVYPELMDLTMQHLQALIACVPVFCLQCTISQEAVMLSKSILDKGEVSRNG